MKRLIVAALLALGCSLSAWAHEAVPVGDDPAIEARMNKLADTLRCLVCQNETLAASHAELAGDLRQEIREMMKAGKSDQEIVKYLTDRYGDFVLYRPPLRSYTLLLWFGPFIFLGIGGVGWYFVLKRRRAMQAKDQVSAEDLRQAAAILEADADAGAKK
jgi:cytochrome c-type biogenesis protein CcmH